MCYLQANVVGLYVSSARPVGDLLLPVLENEMQLECAKKTRNVKKSHLMKALEFMKMQHKMQMAEITRIGSEKPGDLCMQLKYSGWHQKFLEESNVKAMMEGSKKNMQMARRMVNLPWRRSKKNMRI